MDAKGLVLVSVSKDSCWSNFESARKAFRNE